LGILLVVVGGILKRWVPDETKEKSGRTGVVNLDALADILLFEGPTEGQVVFMRVFRQSGNDERYQEFDTKEEALMAIATQFRRMKEPTVRIWTNTPSCADVRRPYGSGKGTREGKKIWGLEITPERP